MLSHCAIFQVNVKMKSKTFVETTSKIKHPYVYTTLNLWFSRFWKIVVSSHYTFVFVDTTLITKKKSKIIEKQRKKERKKNGIYGSCQNLLKISLILDTYIRLLIGYWVPGYSLIISFCFRHQDLHEFGCFSDIRQIKPWFHFVRVVSAFVSSSESWDFEIQRNWYDGWNWIKMASRFKI